MDSVDDIIEILQQAWDAADANFSKAFKRLKNTITPLHIKLEKPLVCTCQTHRYNHDVPNIDIKVYYCVTIHLPF